MSVFKITAESGFDQVMADAGSDIAMIYYYSIMDEDRTMEKRWRLLAEGHSNLKFAQAEIETAKLLADQNGIGPTPAIVVYYKKIRVDQLIDGDVDQEKLETLAKKWQKKSPVPASQERGFADLTSFLERIQCFNEKIGNDLEGLMDPLSETPLKSEADEQMVLHFKFRPSVNLHSMYIQGVGQETPKRTKVFVNRPHCYHFDEAIDKQADQTITLDHEAREGKLVSMEFQKVKNLELFVESNQGDVEQTTISQLRFCGVPLDSTDMLYFHHWSKKYAEIDRQAR